MYTELHLRNEITNLRELIERRYQSALGHLDAIAELLQSNQPVITETPALPPDVESVRCFDFVPTTTRYVNRVPQDTPVIGPPALPPVNQVPQDTPAVGPSSRVQLLVQYIDKHDHGNGVSVSQIMEGLGLTKKQVYSAVDNAKRQELINSHGRQPKITYKLSRKGISRTR